MVVAQPALIANNCQATSRTSRFHRTVSKVLQDQRIQWFDGASLKIEQAVIDLPEAGRLRLAALWDVRRGALANIYGVARTLALENCLPTMPGRFWKRASGATSCMAMPTWIGNIATVRRKRCAPGLARYGHCRRRQRSALAQRGNDRLASGCAAQPQGSLCRRRAARRCRWAMSGGRWNRGMEFGVAQGILPVLDGSLELHPISGCCAKGDAWRPAISAALRQVSMNNLARRRAGRKCSAPWREHPKVSYDGNEISDGGRAAVSCVRRFGGGDPDQASRPVRARDRTVRQPEHARARPHFADAHLSFGSMQGRTSTW